MRAVPLLLLLSLGCSLPEPAPMPAEAQGLRPVQGRRLGVPVERIFPGVLATLVELGYHVESANRDLGHVRISQTWTDTRLAQQPQYQLAFTLLFQADGPQATRVQVLGTGRVLWSGRHGGQEAGPDQPLGDAQVQILLDRLAERLK